MQLFYRPSAWWVHEEIAIVLRAASKASCELVRSHWNWSTPSELLSQGPICLHASMMSLRDLWNIHRSAQAGVAFNPSDWQILESKSPLLNYQNRRQSGISLPRLYEHCAVTGAFEAALSQKTVQSRYFTAAESSESSWRSTCDYFARDFLWLRIMRHPTIGTVEVTSKWLL